MHAANAAACRRFAPRLLKLMSVMYSLLPFSDLSLLFPSNTPRHHPWITFSLTTMSLVEFSTITHTYNYFSSGYTSSSVFYRLSLFFFPFIITVSCPWPRLHPKYRQNTESLKKQAACLCDKNLTTSLVLVLQAAPRTWKSVSTNRV